MNTLFVFFVLGVLALGALYFTVSTIQAFVKLLKTAVEGGLVVMLILLLIYFAARTWDESNNSRQVPVPEEVPVDTVVIPAQEDVYEVKIRSGSTFDQDRYRIGAISLANGTDTMIIEGRTYVVIPADRYKGGEPKVGKRMVIDGRVYYLFRKERN